MLGRYVYSVDGAVKARYLIRVLPINCLTVAEFLWRRLMVMNLSRSGSWVASCCSLDISWKPLATVVETTVHLCAVVLHGIRTWLP